ncbi:1-deoxy-D-xylulose-5-phosphate synthase [Polynucleobacter paneuropaeus]|jgi:1-deoxy-D-xylulose-5-phosphate synthase|uniref:1-deoxy-D-xylulose-5-phosphate synthase n=1 Tax=Polynucleobacter paneuropaeus TaxID=2527775 RepID=A0AAE2YKB7_9BURK|nr:1-deoxy-D-xylulose-5-phosphate synthase [Polynucleobacter paneuropaeus]AWW48422.1 1-deoxy-D-xylulose-5-phosphate synthase [Polynucleobacter paneuropaeus]MBT8515069.1 1-deoxy-D-xylulose-5-phosphate synthase [Polynucleobacter paneuropaeus]MBT8521407.1 1-deoxy-D-xylulose-5-phosphate synthase [Polynucleobacter paneuropaeus]MBT8525274.1 1-deoxy-D-xylulose-5-phosphate synthase [Polynucleobacter paneuropaeus]MBT8528645.1 1-deoxy-D-xylulose-5-phosphate synthase [Polynucleobacter paneuropaeus]
MTLDSIHSPADLKKLSRDELPALADELRQFVLDSVSQTGGHLSSNLGTVELSIALHYVFDTPADRIVWDVGHQSYPHKILTGRREQMKTLRQFDGLAGFPRRSESEYDAFGTGHSSTSISAAMGMARAFQTLGEHQVAVAVIGDSAMTGGMAFEAMNNAGVYDDLPLVVILNDNDMSISPAVGALNRHLARLLSGNIYSATKKGIDSVLSIAPPLREFAKRLEDHAKGMVSPSTIFQEFGFNYFGPIDGHDLDALVPMLQNVRRLAIEGRGPQFLHVVTRKGQGYELAEADPVLYHGPSKFNPDEGVKKPTAPANKTFTQVFGEWLCDMANADPLLIGITPAMREGSGLVEFEKQFPNRYYDVGIAEQHAVTFAAGMACEGMKPVVAIYSTFLQRAYDQLIHDVAIQDLPILFALDRAGLVGADGATHAGSYDIAFLRCIPNMLIMTPSDEAECRDLLTTAYHQNHPSAVRYPRGAGVGATPSKELRTVPFGKAELRRKSSAASGQRIAILAFGTLLYPALEVGEQLNATVANMRFVKPLDVELLKTLAQDHDYFVTIEDGVIQGGAGSACLEALAAMGLNRPLLQLGLPDSFIEHGDYKLLMANCGLNAEGILKSIHERFSAVLPVNWAAIGK